jgi:predicted AAA+ superfamily ATPase
MALSNRDRIGKMFDLISPALDAFIDRVLGPELSEGADWVHLVAAKDGKQRPADLDRYSRTDPYMQLRMLSEGITGRVQPGWYPFRDYLTRGQEAYASELRDVRHKWAHGDPFSADDTYRALDTAERLLRAADAADAADEVAKLRVDFRRVTADADERRVARVAAVNSSTEGLQPWREVLQPHEDVASGNFKASEFAADLYKVSTGDPDQGREYTDPAEFFARTYVTEGLRDLVGRAVRRLSGDRNASPVINLQTNFGGGKTHSMLSLWHLAAGADLAVYPQEVQDLLSDSGYDAVRSGGGTVRRVALVGNHLAPSGSDERGIRINTLWGELAYQLGGEEGFALVAEADRTSTNPGQVLHELLRRYAPAVILIDEWVAYARQLYGRDDMAGGTFDTQFTFAQALTEAVKSTPGVLLAISIPASYDPDRDGEPTAGSDEEVGGEYGKEALRKLQNVVRRVADHWQPATADEAFHIVRRRLFVQPDARALATMSATAKQFVEMYRRDSADFPRETRDPAYEDRIKRTYPIHPELFDRLYDDWSTLERFQRTRGVLRLMNAVIHELWVAGDMSPLIMPGSIPLATARVNEELTQYLADSWRAIIHSDVDGPSCVPAEIDRKPLFGKRSIARRLARTVFFGAAPTIGAEHPGVELSRVFLGTAVPGDVPGNFHSALNQLSDKATYFYAQGGKYWYDTRPNISRRAKDQAERLHDEDVWAEITRRLEQHRTDSAGFARVVAAPEDSGDIADVDDVRLVLVPPKYGYSTKAKQESPAVAYAKAATERCASANRTFRNAVVFLAGDADRLEELSSSIREYLGWKKVADQAVDLDLTAQQTAQATDRRDRADRTATDRLLGAYHWALTPESSDPGKPFAIGVVKADASTHSLPERATRKLVNEGLLATERAAQSIRLDLDTWLPRVWERGHVRVGELWGYYATYPYMPRLRDRRVLDEGIRSAMDVLVWDTNGFAIAEGYDEQSDRYTGLVLPGDGAQVSVRDDLLIVRPDRASAQRQRELAEQQTDSAVEDLQDDDTPVTPKPQPPSDEVRAKRRFFGSRTLSSDRYALDFKKITDEVVQHLAAVPGVRLAMRIEIEAETDEGFSEDKIRTVSENAATLKFEQSGFEEA